jgi:molybdate transport system ATP-binding protein
MLDVDVVVQRGAFVLEAALGAAPGEIVAVVGPNGAGKTTLLRAVAGLTPIKRGSVRLSGRVLDDTSAGVHVTPQRRRIGMVFQDHVLFPHLSALENVAFPPRAAGLARPAARRAAAAWLERTGAAHRSAAKPGALSGGEAQRVALARALVHEPDLVVLDEPLSALDVEARHSVRHDLASHLNALRVPCLVVTHDPLEAALLAHRLVVLEEGTVVQVGTLGELTRRPRSPWAARLVGTNLYRGTARDQQVAVGDVVLTAIDPPSGAVFAAIPPHAVTLHVTSPQGSARNVWTGTVASIAPLGSRVRVSVEGPLPIVAEITPDSLDRLHLAASPRVWVSVKATEVEVYPA